MLESGIMSERKFSSWKQSDKDQSKALDRLVAKLRAEGVIDENNKPIPEKVETKSTKAEVVVQPELLHVAGDPVDVNKKETKHKRTKGKPHAGLGYTADKTVID